jgi:DNA-directed RNA polymerase specialized sigma24 family protein
MESNSDQVFAALFQLLEPNARSIEEGFQWCRFKLFKFFDWRNCDDAEDLADETIKRLITNVRAGHQILTDNPYSYVYGIAMNVCKEYWRRKKKNPVVIDIDGVADLTVPIVDADCKRHCLEQLPKEKYELLIRYYLDPEEREALAREQQGTLNALRLQIYRIRSGLRDCFKDCQKHSGTMRN